ncbi:MAG TPA: tRNA (adenosine(37)-N6)-threonylcarbamoyltransferase complex ATPase subunit type 1 TsaE [Actinomycetes bacterium]
MGEHELRLLAADEATTKAVGAALVRVLVPGDLVGLTGDLGAGKTRLVQGALAALGVQEPVISPTFMLVREYEGDMPVNHVDAYRLAGAAELEDLGVEEVFTPDAVVFVEWVDRVLAAVPENWLELVLHTRPDEVREVVVRPHGPGWQARYEQLEAALGPFTGSMASPDPFPDAG